MLNFRSEVGFYFADVIVIHEQPEQPSFAVGSQGFGKCRMDVFESFKRSRPEGFALLSQC